MRLARAARAGAALALLAALAAAQTSPPPPPEAENLPPTAPGLAPYFDKPKINVCFCDQAPYIACQNETAPSTWTGYDVELFRRVMPYMGWTDSMIEWYAAPRPDAAALLLRPGSLLSTATSFLHALQEVHRVERDARGHRGTGSRDRPRREGGRVQRRARPGKPPRGQDPSGRQVHGAHDARG
jgi:hypothetical protein